jgi:hypothetical protein
MVKVNDRVVIATIEGTGELKPVQQLANQLAVTLRHPVIVNLRTLPALEGIASSP